MQNEPTPQPFGQYLKAYFKNMGRMITHPWAFLPTLAISAAWIVLGIAQTRMAASPAFDWANFFTFTQGGLFGGLTGAIGGIVGKILIATLLNALIMPLLMKGSRPFAKFGKGFGGFFRSFAFDSGRALANFLTGIAIALLLYSVMNITQRWQEGLVGVAGAVLLIKSIGQKGGMLFSLLFSFVSGLTRRGQVPSYQGIMRLLSGMAVGFTAGTVMNAFGLRWAVFIAACALALAFLFVWFGKRHRAAFTVASVAALLLVPVYAGSPTSQDQMPQEFKELYDKANDQSIGAKVERLQQLAIEAEARGDHAAADRYANQIAEIYMGQANAAMDLYKMAQQYQGTGGTGNPFTDYDENGNYSDGEETDGAEQSIGGGFFDWKPNLDDDFWEKVGMDPETIGQIEQVATEGWADERSQEKDEDDVTTLEGIAAGAAAATAAGAAAGGAAGGAGGGGLPDFPDGGDYDWEATEREERDDEEEEEEDTEGGDGDGGKDPFKNNPYVQNHGDGSLTMTSPSTGQEITLVQKEDGTWENPLTGAQYDDNDVNAWVQDQQENASHWQTQTQINQDYKDKFEQDAAEFASRSEEDRLNAELEREHEQEMLNKGFTPEKIAEIQKIAQKYDVPIVDSEGNPRDIELVKQDTERAYDNVKRVENMYMAIYAEEELNASLWLADAELVDNVAEGTVNILGEAVPGGKVVKDFHNFTKATLVGGMEAHCQGRSVVVGLVGGAAEGALTVGQNHLGDVSKDAGLGTVKKVLFEGTVNVYFEGTKTVIHELSRGASVEDAVDKAQVAIIKKTGEVFLTTVYGGVVDAAKGGPGGNNIDLREFLGETAKATSGELYSRTHDMIVDKDQNASQILNQQFSDWKNEKVEQMYLVYYGVKE